MEKLLLPSRVDGRGQEQTAAFLLSSQLWFLALPCCRCAQQPPVLPGKVLEVGRTPLYLLGRHAAEHTKLCAEEGMKALTGQASSLLLQGWGAFWDVCLIFFSGRRPFLSAYVTSSRVTDNEALFFLDSKTYSLGMRCLHSGQL